MTDKQNQPLGKSSLARMAGNIAAGLVLNPSMNLESIEGLALLADLSVKLATMIAARLEGGDDPIR